MWFLVAEARTTMGSTHRECLQLLLGTSSYVEHINQMESILLAAIHAKK